MALNGEQRRELHEAMLSAFDQDGLTQLVRFELGVPLGNVVSVDNGLDAITFELIEWTEQRGTTDALVLAVYKARPKNEKVLGYCQRHAPSVFGAQRPPATMALEVTRVLEGVADAARQADGAKVKQVIMAFAGDLDDARRVINLLRKYKFLHDQLHTVDFRLYGVIKRAAALFRGNADEQVALHDYTGELRDSARSAGETARDLPSAQSELGWIGNVTRAAELLDSAIAGAAGEPERRALALLKMVLVREPSRINGQMMLLAGQLQDPLDGLTKALNDLEAADPARAEQLRSGRSDLERLRPRLLGLLEEHDSWQRIDNQLRLVPESTGQPLDDLMVVWPDIASAARELCGLRRDRAWAAELGAAAGRFDVAAAAGKSMEQRLALSDFARLARKRFFDVDTELHALCASLVQIAEPLTKMLGLIGR